MDVERKPPEGYFWFTVLTATYNRGRLLPRVHQSLAEQSFKDFEWLIVDDGSKDQTRIVAERLIAASPFPVRYFFQHNSGKMAAINRGIQEAQGYFTGILDDDDCLLPAALETCLQQWLSIPDSVRGNFSSVAGLCCDTASGTVGCRYPRDIMDSDPLEITTKHKVTGDKWGVTLTRVWREFPFPTDLGSFVPEALVFNRRARKYKSRFFNEYLLVKDYQVGGLTYNNIRQRVKSPLGSLTYNEELIQSDRPIPFAIRLRHYVNFARFSLHAGRTLLEQWGSAPSKTAWIACLPVGFALFLNDRRVVGRAR